MRASVNLYLICLITRDTLHTRLSFSGCLTRENYRFDVIWLNMTKQVLVKIDRL